MLQVENVETILPDLRKGKVTKPATPQEKNESLGETEPQPLDVDGYIRKRRNERAKDEVIAVELHHGVELHRGKINLSYADVARKFGLTEGLHALQHDAIKQRGVRFCKKGKAILSALET